jgi:cyclic pyranopterin phosphate synthase
LRLCEKHELFAQRRKEKTEGAKETVLYQAQLLLFRSFNVYSLNMKRLSHMDERGRVKMVDTSAKIDTARRAVASARVLMSPETVAAVREHRTPKGDPLETARLAGIMAAKRTAELIPLCHPLPLTFIDVRAEISDTGVLIEAEAATQAQTGVEMEALTAATVAALTVYDMCKAVDKAMTITDVRLEMKSGGKSGDYKRNKRGRQRVDSK